MIIKAIVKDGCCAATRGAVMPRQFPRFLVESRDPAVVLIHIADDMRRLHVKAVELVFMREEGPVFLSVIEQDIVRCVFTGPVQSEIFIEIGHALPKSGVVRHLDCTFVNYPSAILGFCESLPSGEQAPSTGVRDWIPILIAFANSNPPVPPERMTFAAIGHVPLALPLEKGRVEPAGDLPHLPFRVLLQCFIDGITDGQFLLEIDDRYSVSLD